MNKVFFFIKVELWRIDVSLITVNLFLHYLLAARISGQREDLERCTILCKVLSAESCR